MHPADVLLTILLYAALVLAVVVFVGMALATAALALDLRGIRLSRREQPAAPANAAAPATRDVAPACRGGEPRDHPLAEQSERAAG